MNASALAALHPDEGRRRVIVERVTPEVDGGQFPVKREQGDKVVVEASVFADGHDRVTCALLYREAHSGEWQAVTMAPLGNDRWRASFAVERCGRYQFTVEGWIDTFGTWRHDLQKRAVAQQDLALSYLTGAALIAEALKAHPTPADARVLENAIAGLGAAPHDENCVAVALDEVLAAAMARHRDAKLITRYDKELEVVVDPKIARFSAWYEMFPRSASNEARHGSLRDCVDRLPYISTMGFDVLYLPPIHPIGRAHRKGKNNAPEAEPGDVGSPWAIGAAEGGHKAVHPDLGSMDDFRALVAAASGHGIAIALDIAFQCAPDHPYVTEHPSWFRHRPDGSIQYAENPPKKYQDIYPFDFESSDWQGMWAELKSIFDFWIAEGVTIFRVDNPHTKAFPFWQWVIGAIKQEHPEVIFLSEAFTRPAIMHRLAKVGFSQSYTYFTWRNTKAQIQEYLTELAQGLGREYLRPNLWPNTPDILPEYLQVGGRPASVIRVTLAATLGASYGIYGPVFELAECTARVPGGEEYLDSEKYQLRHWDRTHADSLQQYIARLNRVRRENPALHHDANLRFHAVDNDQIIAYSKHTDDLLNAVLVIVNLDPYNPQSGWLELSMDAFEIDAKQPYQMHDLLSGSRYLWHGARNFVRLDPVTLPAHVFRLRRRMRSERDFDYFL